ncbi:MAG TPA: AsmA family protein [Vicinamibacteria bacterium]|nr:AsmA family protein [Vicinamibacteria bacterium]
MRKALLGCAALLLLVTIAGLGALALLARRLNTAELRQSFLAQARAAIGADVAVKTMDVSLLSGVTLTGISVENPAPFPGRLLTAERFVLRYRLLPLLTGRVEVERLALEKPALGLAMDARGSFNYERLGGPARRTPASATSAAPATALHVVLKQLSVTEGSVVMTDHSGSRLLAIDGADFRSAFEVAGGIARGSGEARVATVDLASLLFVRALRSPIEMSRESVRLAPVRGRVAGGDVTGDVTVHLKDGFRYVANLEVKGADVRTLLAEAKSTAGVSGTLRAKASFEGRGGMATMKGRGEATVDRCRVEHAAALALLADVLKVPELKSPDFEECRVEFVQSGSRLTTPAVSLRGQALRLTGRGSVNLDTYGLDYDMRLALAPKLLAKVTRPELRSAFQDGGDGFSSIDFRLFGTTLDPRTDLVSRVGKAAATSAAKGQLDRLFKKK